MKQVSQPPCAIVEILTFVLVVGLTFVKIDPYYERIFFIGFVSFIMKNLSPIFLTYP